MPSPHLSTPMRYIIVATKPWNRRVYRETIRYYPGEWFFFDKPEDVILEKVRALAPQYVFFLHWSWKVPGEVVKEFECVCFHMTDVPYGRGGSPLQNLILRGHRQTKLTALRMTEQVDAGPVYLKEDLCLEGSAEEIYMRASRIAARMIRRIIEDRIEPIPQFGDSQVFSRRTPDESEIADCEDLRALHDFIRMLDAEGYPRAFLTHGGYRYEFSRAVLYDGRIVADVTITSEKRGS